MVTTPTDARVVREASWHTDVVDSGAIQDKLNQLWSELSDADERIRADSATAHEVEADAYGPGLLTRASTLNLLAVAESDEAASLIHDTVNSLTEFFPSRTIVLVDREMDAEGSGYDVRVELLEQPSTGSAPGLRYETITIAAPHQDAANLASLVSPLLVTELSDFLWWPNGQFPNNPLFQELAEVADRLIIDAAQLGARARGLDVLSEMIGGVATAPILGDFTWLRLNSWRQLIAQFFDPPSVQPCLQTIDQVAIDFAESRRDGSSGFASALLTTGWLASRLGWEVVEPLEQRRSGAWWGALRGQHEGRGRDIEVRLTPESSPHTNFSLRRATITASGNAPGTFRIERTDSDDLMTSSETPSMPEVSRMVYAKRPEARKMLSEELQRFGHDKIYEQALLIATRLAPAR
jgi:glucose-6-phosphate dehydrogenase assembly protein OpcA